MQLMPQTAAILGVRDAFNARQNIRGGTRHLRFLMERFRHNPRLAVAAYNAGEKAVMAHRGVPPYPETQQYVVRVLRHYSAQAESIDAQAGGAQGVVGDGVYRSVRPDGTLVYTNVP
jgi:soluble lytic murein transglycosylase-like protein